MTKKLLVIALSAGLALSACARKKAPSGEKAEEPSGFELSLKEAKGLLAKSYTGKQVVHDLEAKTKNGQLAKITPLTEEERKKNNLVNPSGLRKISNGVYEIWIAAELKDSELAHALAHETVHLNQYIEQDAFVEENTKVKEQLVLGAKLLTAGKVDENDKNQKESADLALLSNLFQEAKAYQVNMQLDKEGLPYKDGKDIKEMTLQKFLESKYIPKTINAPAEAAQIEKATGSFDTVVEFQKHLLANRSAANP